MARGGGGGGGGGGGFSEEREEGALVERGAEEGGWAPGEKAREAAERDHRVTREDCCVERERGRECR